jgi:two-component system nitrate/nitrite response regulator NarL
MPTERDDTGLVVDTTPVVRLLVVAEVRLYREGIQNALAARSQFAVVGAVSDADQALKHIALHQPEVVILDMATRQSLEIARTIHEQAPAIKPEIKIVAFGVEELEGDVLVCAEAGLSGYVPFDASVEDLVERVESVARGELLCTPKIAAALFRKMHGRRDPAGGPADALVLTSREREVLGLMNDGFSNEEIATRLYIEVSTVKNHVHHILEKLQVSSRAQAVMKRSSQTPADLRRASHRANSRG